MAGQITIGWNLGNTLEAICGETAWGNPTVTQQFINSVKAAGFNAVRIPAAWDCHADQSTLTIDPAWMTRVKEVVDYAYGQGMYVILNIHWDGGWLEEHPLYSHQQAVNKKQRAYWTQIANTFKGYNERLLFAGTNEVHADYGTPTTEHITVQQSYLQTFVDAVRATGGNNASRTLVVQTYNTNSWHGLDYFSLPSDTIANRLIVEVHHYDPYDYTLNTNNTCAYWGAPYPVQGACSWAQEAYHDDLFARVKAKWIAQGVPVIIGEYGVATRPNLNLESRQYYLEYVNRAAAANGIKTFYWDNGVNPGQTNGFALFNRSNGAVVDQGALDAIRRGAGPVNPNSFTLTVTKSGAGGGTVTSSPSGIDCGSTCGANYSSGTSVTLSAAAASGSTFAGWSGACSGTGTCTVSMTAARSVTATFNTSGGSTTCSNPITFSGSTGNFNTTGAACYRTNANINGWGCHNFDGRTVTVGGQARTCSQMPLTRSSDGYYYFAVSGGEYSWAGLYTW
ncbi:Endo-1,4-beta-xylanase A precursor [Cystobacter fuscus DSM 2262]|uniref:Endo-1,4-beta-xylanase A n=1 Tax=Cystobacter fuscus (strain ATCC 25194 / DSM 2262 / NBRC 100088 / M29) TaxID=1242864 RepID=S9PK30_CYSF2|nr:Endo-1,4-beta-xylanase A precursor [Cystobacter fuscus DSM 2262]